jgi:hypothetical protein
MNHDYINIACSPLDEEYLQVGSTSEENLINEVRRFLEMLIPYCRNSGVPEHLISNLSIKSFHHVVGRYWEVICCFNDDENDADNEEVQFAYWLERNTPLKWTDIKASENFIVGETL